MNLKFILPIFFIFAVFGCSNKKAKLKFEQNVFYQVVPKIIESQFSDFKGPFMIKSKIEDGSYVWSEEESVNAIIGIMDSVYGFDEPFYYKYVKQHFSNLELKFDTLNYEKGYQLDISKIEKIENYTCQYYGELPGPNKRWIKSKDFYLLGLIGFSRIKFDEKKQYGVMDFKTTCGQQCGVTAIVYLKNMGERWEVDKIEPIIME